jgi:glycosyltransferase involved in cell wall biosynthesis
MRIGVIHHSDDVSNDYAAYIAALIDNTAEENGYTINDYEQLLRFREPLKGDNAFMHIIIPASKRFSLKYWYNAKLPRIVKKYKLDKLICTYGVGVNAPAPQLLLFPEIALLQKDKKMLLWQEYALKNLQKSVERSTSIITYSNTAKEKLENATTLNTEKILVMPYSVHEVFQPMEWHDKLYIKSRFSQNAEYFVAVLPDNDEKNFVELLRAFSKFKKWQQSGMQLLLLPKEEAFSSNIDNKLDTYKYKNDVKLINDADMKETANIIATAYALLHITTKDSDLWPVSAAMQCSTPVLAYYTESMQEYCGEAGTFVKEHSHEAFGEQLISLYKDETLRTKMSEAALEKAKLYNQKDHAAKLWELINRA